MKNILTRFGLFYPTTIVYMLQSSEYDVVEYFKWVQRTTDFSNVMRRSTLKYTNKAKVLLVLSHLTTYILYALVIVLWFVANDKYSIVHLYFSIMILVATPWFLAYFITIPLILGKVLIQNPRERQIIKEAKSIIKNHNGLKVAIVGSFGKTTAKEILATILTVGKNIACTPGNMNTPIGISRFAKKLSGDEDVLIFEMGEAKVGDIKELCELTGPDMGIITGINEAHLSNFGTIENTIKTIFELIDYLGEKPVYKNSDSPILEKKILKNDKLAYSRDGINGWKVLNVESGIFGLHFDMIKDGEKIHLETMLIGEHNIGIIAASVVIAKQLGMTHDQIIEGVSYTKPFEHRMEPKYIHGAWIIDDTYNGNFEGVLAGLKLLKETEAKRRIYVTPGLVEHGDKTSSIHAKIGKEISKVADVVVLMKNSATRDIASGLENGNFRGELKIVDDPLDFYTNIEHFVAAGDVVLMQNDWTDNYA